MKYGRQALKEKVSAFCTFLNVTEDAFVFNNIEDPSNFIDQVVLLLKENHHLFSALLYKIFDLRLRHILKINYNIEKFKDFQQIDYILPKGLVEPRLKQLESEVGLMFPRPVISRTNLVIQLMLFLFPGLLFVSGLLLHVEFLVVIYGLVKLGVLTILLFLPNIVAYFLFPRLYQPSKLHGINTYHDLVQDLVIMNRHYYVEDNYKRTSEELKDLIEAL